MVDQLDCLWTLLSLLVNLLQVLRKAISMALSSNSSPHHVLEMAIKNCKVHPAAGDENPATVSVTEGPGVAEEASVSSHCEVAVRESLERKKRVSLRARKRPGRIIIPESFGCLGFGEVEKEQDLGEKEIEVEGGEFCLASRRGSRHVMEDGYGVITNIHGDYKQAYFGVFDGHGGRAAVDFVAENLGKNIFAALAERAEEEREHEEEEEEEEDHLELAIKQGYLTTDKEFLSQGVSSGACAATVLLKDGDLRVANVGDCRVVISRKGVATALTNDHRPGREDERLRIENLGGYVNCKNGTWRVQDSLAVSRSIGDMNMKEWIISEPEMSKLRLTSDCEFLILASDGLWDKVANQEAVDVVSRSQHSIKSCKELVELSWRRGGRDDITVMVVDLQRFV